MTEKGKTRPAQGLSGRIVGLLITNPGRVGGLVGIAGGTNCNLLSLLPKLGYSESCRQETSSFAFGALLTGRPRGASSASNPFCFQPGACDEPLNWLLHSRCLPSRRRRWDRQDSATFLCLRFEPFAFLLVPYSRYASLQRSQANQVVNTLLLHIC